MSTSSFEDIYLLIEPRVVEFLTGILINQAQRLAHGLTIGSISRYLLEKFIVSIEQMYLIDLVFLKFVW